MVINIRILVAILTCLINIKSFGQNDSVPIKDKVVTMLILESWPTYKGGQKALLEMIDSNLVYPKNALEKSIEGKVFIQFLVDSLGNTKEHIVIKGVCETLDKEALRLSQLIKFEKPAIQRGKPVAIKFNMIIVFRLPVNDNNKKIKKNEN